MFLTEQDGGGDLQGTPASEPLQSAGAGGPSTPLPERGSALSQVQGRQLQAGKSEAGKSAAVMDRGDTSHDACPNCGQRFEILLVKFALAGVRMIAACPNCAMVCCDNRPTRRQPERWWKRGRVRIPFGPA
jgi:hypothetical protein